MKQSTRRVFFLIFLTLLLTGSVMAQKKNLKPSKEVTKDDIRTLIGPTVSSPVFYEGSLYFLAANGILYKSDKEIKQVEKLLETDKNSASGILLHEGKLYFGDGLHEDKQAALYIYDLKLKKMIKKIPLQGHVERIPSTANGKLFVGMGAGGVAAIDLNTLKILWSVDKVEGKKLHIDSTPVIHKKNVCMTSVYDFKAVVCLEQDSGKLAFSLLLSLDPKSETGISQNFMFGFMTEANLMEPKWDIPSRFYVVDLESGKLVVDKLLRGFTFFRPLILGPYEVMLGLSTGDIITTNLKNGDIGYVGEFPEPMLTTPFVYKDSYCVVGIMGKLLCYKKAQKGYALAKEERFYETVIGNVTGEIEGRVYLPSRTGYFILD